MRTWQGVAMPTQPLCATTPDRHPALPFLGGLRMARARVHEVCGPARRTLALMVAQETGGQTGGPVIWIQAGWLPERLFPDGISPFIAPARLIFITARRAEDLLWSMEEALRPGAVALVVADLPVPPGLVAVRRLHLAAQTGAAEGRVPPLGLILTPGEGGAPGVESRWHLAPRHGPGQDRWRLERLRARADPPKVWQVDMSATGALGLGQMRRPPPAMATEPRPDSFSAGARDMGDDRPI
jgi:protein ImuA